VSLLAACGGGGGSPTAPPPTPTPTPPPPNFVVIMADDLEAQGIARMPLLESLLTRQGTRFANSFVTTPLCAPSRATFLTGQYTHTHGVFSNGPPLGGFQEWHALGRDANTIGVWLKAADFIRRAESNDAQPFFLFVGVSAPHLPPVPASRHAGEFGRLEVPKPSSFNEDDVRDKPGYVQRTRQLTTEEIEEIDEEYTDRQRTMLAVDEAIERLVRTLEETGELANTYIIFTSDNGIFQGEHRQTGKSAAYDEAIRVPLIIRGPGVPVNRSLDHLVANIDLAPTLLSLGRAPIPDTVEGRSLEPLLGASPPATTAWRRELLIEYLGGSGGSESLGPVVRADQLRALAVRGMPDYFALRNETHSYVEYVSGEKEMYDLARDGQQLDNLMQLGGDPVLAATLSTRLGVLRTCRGAACRQ